MSTFDFLFESIARFSILAFLLLGAGTIGLRFFRQPLERIRSIQISLLCVFLVAILSQASWKPSIDLPVLPASESSQWAGHADSHSSETPALNAAQAIISWDQQTYMPPGGAEVRGHQLATLGSLTHQKFTAPEIGQLIEDIKAELGDTDPDSDDARYIKVLSKDYDEATKVPSEYVAKFAKLTAQAHENWAKAREASDFSLFQNDLEEILTMLKEYVTFFPPKDHPYDTLLDQYEPLIYSQEDY